MNVLIPSSRPFPGLLRHCLAAGALLALTACAATPVAVSKNQPSLDVAALALPPMRGFAAAPGQPTRRSNAEIAADFMDLEFVMESGRALPVLSRFEGPITVALTGAVPPSAPADLGRLVRRLQTEAGLDVSMRTDGADAAITVEFLPRARLQGVAPTAACFVVPNASSWAEYRARRNSDMTDWGSVTTRTRAAVFIPSDTSPQEVRDCLHEEVSQAIGPLNDLYRVPDSIFNDDNFHTVLTGFDMLMLRLHYAPELHSGMTAAEVRARLPGLLARLNPGGAHGGAAPGHLPPRAWTTAVETAFGPRVPDSQRRAAANRALAIAQSEGWQDAQLAFSYFAVGRLNVAGDTATAVTAFAEAARIYRSLPGGEVHGAHIDMQMAAYALSSGQAEEAVILADRAIPVVTRAENAALLATLLMIKAEAFGLLGRADAAQALRLDSLGWARYGFGSEAEVRARANEIAALAPRGARG